MLFSIFIATLIIVGCSKKRKSSKEAKNPARSSIVGRPVESTKKPTVSPVSPDKEKEKEPVDAVKNAKSPKSSVESKESPKSHKEVKESPKSKIKTKGTPKKEKQRDKPERSGPSPDVVEVPEPSGTSTARTGPPLQEPMETAKENESNKKTASDVEEGHDGGYEKLDAMSNEELKRIAEEAPN